MGKDTGGKLVYLLLEWWGHKNCTMEILDSLKQLFFFLQYVCSVWVSCMSTLHDTHLEYRLKNIFHIKGCPPPSGRIDFVWNACLNSYQGVPHINAVEQNRIASSCSCGVELLMRPKMDNSLRAQHLQRSLGQFFFFSICYLICFLFQHKNKHFRDEMYNCMTFKNKNKIL